jgi:hypothetical protein
LQLYGISILSAVVKPKHLMAVDLNAVGRCLHAGEGERYPDALDNDARRGPRSGRKS